MAKARAPLPFQLFLLLPLLISLFQSLQRIRVIIIDMASLFLVDVYNAESANHLAASLDAHHFPFAHLVAAFARYGEEEHAEEDLEGEEDEVQD